uniref:Uncharacterized protein n=1 Tax=viral metagenome TaxID=1070528 RepID=A0A6C0CAR4_9ZZZZ
MLLARELPEDLYTEIFASQMLPVRKFFAIDNQNFFDYQWCYCKIKIDPSNTNLTNLDNLK